MDLVALTREISLKVISMIFWSITDKSDILNI